MSYAPTYWKALPWTASESCRWHVCYSFCSRAAPCAVRRPGSREAHGQLLWVNSDCSGAGGRRRACCLGVACSCVQRRDAAKLTGCFTPKAEFVDDAGNVHRGIEEIGAVFKAFRGKFPKATMELAVDSIRLAGEDLAVEDGTRTVKTEDARPSTSTRRSTSSGKETGLSPLPARRRRPEPTPHVRLQPWRGSSESGWTKAPRPQSRSIAVGMTAGTSCSSTSWSLSRAR